MVERGWVEGRKDHLMRRGRGAETSDRIQREAYPGLKMKSAYAHHLAIPDVVQPSDHQTAHLILKNVREVLDKGGWTTNEFNRLRIMEKAWARRASGNDPVFNLRGWRRQGTGHNLNPTLKALAEISGLLEGSGK